MKLSLFNRRGQLAPTINVGPAMWRCTNGAPNYRRAIWVRNWYYKGPEQCAITLTPALTFTPWHESCLGHVDSLGQSSASFTVAIEWWHWSWGFMFGVTRNDKTTEEINRNEKHHSNRVL